MGPDKTRYVVRGTDLSRVKEGNNVQGRRRLGLKGPRGRVRGNYYSVLSRTRKVGPEIKEINIDSEPRQGG